MTAAEAGAIAPDTRQRLTELAPGVYALVQLDGTWGLSNAGLVVGRETVVLVDTFFTERRNAELRKTVLQTARKSPDLIVNTHHHGDHVFGNGWFPEAVIVSHERTRECMGVIDPGASAGRFTDVDFGEVRPTPADVTFAEGLRLHAGDLTLDVFYPGLAHCVGNSAIHIPEHSILFAGDLLLKGCTPTFVGGSVAGFLTVLTTLRALEAETIVPGHGPVCGPEVIDETERYVRFVQEIAAAEHRAGKAPLEVAQTADLGEFHGWLDHERIVGNLYRAYAEIDGTGTVDTKAMWRDTTAYLGRPMRSWA